MIDKYLNILTGMPMVDVIENGAIVLILVLGLIIFFRSSSPFSRYFIPIVCILGALLRIVHWAQNGDEPGFMTPVVSLVASWLS